MAARRRAGRHGRHVAGALVMAQLALALLLLAGAGLLIKTVVRLGSASTPASTRAPCSRRCVTSRAALQNAGVITVFVNGVSSSSRACRNPRRRPELVFFAGSARNRGRSWSKTSDRPDGASPNFYFAVTPGYFRMPGRPDAQGS